MKPAIVASILLILIALSSATFAEAQERALDIPPNGLGLLMDTPASPTGGIYVDARQVA